MTKVHLFTARTAAEMRVIGEALGRAARGGDVLVLSGELGAGKTTLTQGIGAGMGVEDRVTSPTFVIARIHENPTGGPRLAHVDAYRLGSVAEIDDLDLDADLDRCVVVVEWGAGLVEDLTADRIDIAISRSDTALDERRTVAVQAQSARWAALLDDWSAGGVGA
jgi:tRNA threonylcarbamoyladenosine biosynthesis protein TsaE